MKQRHLHQQNHRRADINQVSVASPFTLISVSQWNRLFMRPLIKKGNKQITIKLSFFFFFANFKFTYDMPQNYWSLVNCSEEIWICKMQFYCHGSFTTDACEEN